MALSVPHAMGENCLVLRQDIMTFMNSGNMNMFPKHSQIGFKKKRNANT